MEGRTNKNKEIKTGKFNTKLKFKKQFKKTKFHYKPTFEVGNV
jgi:hypothetical protein